MKDVQKEKYFHLMEDIETLEDKVEKLEAQGASEELTKLQEELIDKKNELARVSDGCGTPHTH